MIIPVQRVDSDTFGNDWAVKIVSYYGVFICISNKNCIIDCVVSYRVPAVGIVAAVHTVLNSVLLHPLMAATISSLGHYASNKTWLR